ncbi:universal stress protein [Halapricum desulfuricans]|uniref:Nucleotide-binding protein, UspA family n=1 Tax=Halapricum desulfuricans TaxID=2841257 RepID=A0A897NZL3_9EURY|nr:universal stress protein [Halapricum desulfuricans]QSG16153.1 Nucleotide-binding protein, UspA family [Halapricum desulfuricans]
MYQDILLPTDGSDGAERVAEHAGSLARQYDATVHVLSIADTRNRFEGPTMGLGADAWEDAERERSQAAVEDTVAALPEDVSVDHTVDSGVPHAAILDYAETAGVDVIVMGTHGRTGIDHYLIGSVAERVVRQSPVPVLTVRIGDA